MADGHSASHATNPGVIGGNVLLGSLARSAPLIILRDASGNPVSALANNEERRARFPSRIFAVLSLPSVLLAETLCCKFGFLNSRYKQHKSTTPKVIIDWLKYYLFIPHAETQIMRIKSAPPFVTQLAHTESSLPSLPQESLSLSLCSCFD